MSDQNKFIDLFFSVGISGNPDPIPRHRKLTHIIENVLVLKGDLEGFKKVLKTRESQLRKMRFVWLNKDYYLAIQYQDTIRRVNKRSVVDLRIGTKDKFEKSPNFRIIEFQTFEQFLEEPVEFQAHKFDESTGLGSIFKMEDPGVEMYFGVEYTTLEQISGISEADIAKNVGWDWPSPLNEIHLLKLNDLKKVKLQNNYRPISNIPLVRNDSEEFLIVIRRSKGSN